MAEIDIIRQAIVEFAQAEQGMRNSLENDANTLSKENDRIWKRRRIAREQLIKLAWDIQDYYDSN